MTDGHDGSAPAKPTAVHNAEPFALPVETVRPSQLHLNGRKLSLVTEGFDFADPNYDPLPVRRMKSEGESGRAWILTDGHTRAFVAHLAGADELRVVRDTDDLQMETYRQCAEWCEDEGVTEIAVLAGRVLNPGGFEERWIRRCQAAADSGE